MASNAQRRALKRYMSRVMTITVRVNPRTERDVYERLSRVDNRAGYLKSLVARDALRRAETR